jgi:hypothetical protein
MPKYAGKVNSITFIVNAAQSPIRFASVRLSLRSEPIAPGGPIR